MGLICSSLLICNSSLHEGELRCVTLVYVPVDELRLDCNDVAYLGWVTSNLWGYVLQLRKKSREVPFAPIKFCTWIEFSGDGL